MRKKLILSLFILSACAQSTALIGPAITVGNTGNVLQASFSYGGNMIVKESTGKTPGEHVVTYVEDKREEKRVRKEMVSLIKSHIKLVRNKLSTKK